MISNNGSIDIAKVSQALSSFCCRQLFRYFSRVRLKKKKEKKKITRVPNGENQFAASGIEYLSINGGPSKRKIKVSAKLFTR